ncbi:MAG: YbhB/YbcL family Raf kinase inhibitor-like protein [Acidobacteria bacterium]|nr:MAG: YbhB/YbcL family Raf kinase inhibitor-like protein [Acidobacteriota bacterium]
MAFEFTSSEFKQNEAIPKQYTCDGSDISVPLSWKNAPEGSKSFALIADDPDAPRGTWVHWVLYDLPADVRELSAAIGREESLQNGAKQGKNDFEKIGYGGPCPPSGSAHRYYFKLYALDQMTGLQSKATKQQLLDAMKGHVLAEAQLIGTYKR